MSLVLVTGFGPFLDVHDNPSARLARAVDGARMCGWTVLGEVLPVSYSRGPRRAVTLARHHRAGLVLGLGVAANRSEPWVEQRAVNACSTGRADVDSEMPTDLGDGPAVVTATLPVAPFAEALGCGVSTDAGRYVCNAWLYAVAGALPGVPVGFLHVPLAGITPDRLLAGLRAVLP